MTDPNADLREMVARALVATDVRVSENKEADLYGQMADAALAVARPRIWREAMEAAAKDVALEEDFAPMDEYDRGFNDGIRGATQIIRALSPPVKEGAHE